MATIPSHNHVLQTFPDQDNGADPVVPATTSVSITDSERYTKFLFLVSGCSDNTACSVSAALVGDGVTLSAPVPLIISTSLSSANATKALNTTLAFQVDLCAPALGGLILNLPSNVLAGSVSVSMWGSIYSQGLK